MTTKTKKPDEEPVDLAVNEKGPGAVAAAIANASTKRPKKSATAKKKGARSKPAGAKLPREVKASPFLKDSRLPAVGEKIERVYKGKTHTVTVREDGLEYDGKAYRSLTAVAKAIVGPAPISGPFFFGLSKPKKTTVAAHRARRAPQTARKPRAK